MSNFCLETNLHGFRYLNQENCAKRVIWSLFIVLSFMTAGFLVYKTTEDYLNSTIETKIDSLNVPVSEIYFPSVVICNMNQVRKSYFEELEINETQFKKGQDCKDMFILSQWNESKTYTFEIERDFATDYGNCCWYTPQLNLTEVKKHQKENDLLEPDWGHFFTNLQKGAKVGDGFQMILDIESFDYNFQGSEGLKISLVHHLDMPFMKLNRFHLSPGTENQIELNFELITTSNNAKKRFTPTERNCYFEEEISLKYLPKDHGYRYTMKNCLFESAYEEIIEKCNYMPEFHNFGLETCKGANLKCMEEIFQSFGQFDHVDYNGEIIKCLPSCEDQNNSIFVTSSSYPSRNAFIYQEEFCILTKKLMEKCQGSKSRFLDEFHPDFCSILQPLTNLDSAVFCKNNEWNRSLIPNCNQIENIIFEFAKQNLVKFNIFTSNPFVTRYIKDEKITVVSYITNSGILLTLCTGFSLTTIFEVFYHFILSIFKIIK